jgi:niacin transporter
MKTTLSSRDLAGAGLFGASALLLPWLFHLFHLGSFFMPMYIPLLVLAFVASPVVAVWTAALVPLLSFFLTSMPPLYPPVAPVMSAELALMCFLISYLRLRYPRLHHLVLLGGTLLIGRLVNFGALFLLAKLLGLPAGFIAGLSLIAGWPGILLIMITVPPTIKLLSNK